MTSQRAKFPLHSFSNAARPQVAAQRACRNCWRNCDDYRPAHSSRQKTQSSRTSTKTAPKDFGGGIAVPCEQAGVAERVGYDYPIGLQPGGAQRCWCREGMGRKVWAEGSASGILASAASRRLPFALDYDSSNQSCDSAFRFACCNSRRPSKVSRGRIQKTARIPGPGTDRGPSRPVETVQRNLAMEATVNAGRPRSSSCRYAGGPC